MGDHGTETVAFYVALGSKSRLLNKVYNKIGSDGLGSNGEPSNIGVEKAYDEILDGASARVGILRPHHAHAIHNFSPHTSFTLHVYVPSYEFGLTWDYEQRESVKRINKGTVAKVAKALNTHKEDTLAVKQMYSRKATVYDD